MYVMGEASTARQKTSSHSMYESQGLPGQPIDVYKGPRPGRHDREERKWQKIKVKIKNEKCPAGDELALHQPCIGFLLPRRACPPTTSQPERPRAAPPHLT